MVSIQEFDFTVRHIKGKDNVVADAFSRLCVLKGGPNTRKVSGKKRLLEDPAEEEGSRRSRRLALKKQTKETVPSGIEAPEEPNIDGEIRDRPLDTQTREKGIRITPLVPGLELPREGASDELEARGEIGTDSDKGHSVDMQADPPVVLSDVVTPHDITELIPTVPSTVIILGDGNPIANGTLDEGRQNCEDIQPKKRPCRTIQAKWYNHSAGHH